ncbi:acyl-CoA-binding domain-containing protein 5A isoform X2 [Phycodurus eques]|uniref:acyl-CoA-binding domain-containing protein 5A isoform X2 n=1 Tax=Phycodurus eques TaxID=693459 RepID=UPI002ACD4647|nr:acyl-CoA-binding domain-containing protein 5A isoform X2 [Phycodurus eques]
MEVAQSLGADEQTRLTQLRFDAAVKVIKSLPPNGSFQPSNDMMLKFYSYYKQATVGKCNIARPGFWDAVGKAKWNAWNSLGEMTKEEAMAAYVDEMKLILEGMPMTGEVEELLRILGPFYELVDEKKKITQISDLSTGFGSTPSVVLSRSVAKSVVRTMEMNGTLETRPAEPTPDDRKETSGKDSQEEDEEEVKKASQPKKKASPRSRTAQNEKVANNVARLTNGEHSLVPQDAPGAQLLLNGHHDDGSKDVTGPAQLASDSDSEVYCDSVDQFGQNESPEQNRSMQDLDEEDEEPVDCEEVRGAPQGIRCGGEDGDAGGSVTQRSRLDVDMSNSSVGGGRGSRSHGRGPGALKPARGGGDDDDDGGGGGERRCGAGTPVGSLNEHIVAALAQLQDDMRSVLDRLHTLEALTATQARSAAVSPVQPSTLLNNNGQRPSWWPFDISPSSLAFAVVWPFVVHWLIGLYVQRRRRRLN